MKTLITLKRSLLFIAPVICLTACWNRNNLLDKWSDTDAEFDISKEARIIDEHGVKHKLSDVVVSDSTFVIRVTNKQPAESRRIVLYRARFFTDNYPRTDNIIILADERPSDTGWTSKWGDVLKKYNAQIRVYKIEDSVLSPRLESGQRSYVFFLDKQLHANGIYMPTRNDTASLRTLRYFSTVAGILGRHQTDPIVTEALRAQAEMKARGIEPAPIFWDQTARVGERTAKTTYYEDFSFRNKGKETLEINNITNNFYHEDCGVYIQEKPVSPGSYCKIRIYYRTPSRGSFRNRVKLYTNMTEEPLTFTISGTAVKSSKHKGVSWLDARETTKIVWLTKYIRY